MWSPHSHHRSGKKYTLAELVRLTKERGHNVLVVTDHDTIAGADEARRAGSELDLQGDAQGRDKRP